MFAIGDKEWPGISKLVEEAGEVLQISGKLIATHGDTKHWEGSDLKQRLQDELGDLLAAISFVVEQNNFDAQKVSQRWHEKLMQFKVWHVEAEKHT